MKRSRRRELILSTVGNDFICAVAEGFGVGVAVSYRKLLTAKARLFCRPVLRRCSLREIESIELRGGKNVNRLVVEVGGRQPATVTVLYGTGAAGDFANLVATVSRLARRRCQAGRRSPARRRLAVRHYLDPQPSTSVMP